MGYMGELRQLNVAHRCRQNWLLLPKRAGALMLEGGLGSCALGKGKKRGVRGDLEVSPWFSNSEKGCEGPGLGREKAWKEYSYWKFFCQILEILWMSESGRGQKGGVCMVGRNQELGRIWQTLWIPKIAVRLDSDLFLSSARISFLPPFYPFSRMPFGAHRSPFSIFTSFSHNYILLYKKPCSPPAKSLSLLVTFLHWSVLLSG